MGYRRYLAQCFPWFLLLVWMIVQISWSLPASIAEDWNGWRQVDTQSIAQNFQRNSSSILYPRINWGGDGPGYVEAEFQLYTWNIAWLMRVFGVSEGPGQWISLFAIITSCLAIFVWLRDRYGLWPGVAALGSALIARGCIFTSTAVQPDALGFFFVTMATILFMHYLDRPHVCFLLCSAICTTVASLIKPTALHIGIFQFLAVLLSRRELLRRPSLWAAWGAVLGVMALFFWHGHTVYRDYGNTFGIGFHGDSKFPTLRMLASVGSLAALARMSIAWGFGLLGVLAGLYLLVRRRLEAPLLALIVANIFMIVIAFRYTSNEWWGSHYHVVAVLPGAWLVAAASRDLLDRLNFKVARSIFAICLILVSLAILQRNLELRQHPGLIHPAQKRSVILGKELADMVTPEDLIIVRASAPAGSKAYDTVNNFEDPIIFYLADVRGWVVPSDEPRIDVLQTALAAGARYYVDTVRTLKTPDLDNWLEQHTVNVMVVGESGAIYELKQ